MQILVFTHKGKKQNEQKKKKKKGKKESKSNTIADQMTRKH